MRPRGRSPLLERTVRSAVPVREVLEVLCDHRYHQEGRRRPRLRLHRRRGCEGILLPSRRPRLVARLRPPRRRRARRRSRSRTSPKGPRATRCAPPSTRTARPPGRAAPPLADAGLARRAEPLRPAPLRTRRCRRPERSHVIVRTAFVSTYPPRRCGIATFTQRPRRAAGDREVVVLHRPSADVPYPLEVHHRIRQDEPGDYVRIARALGRCVDVVSIQHEYGIWGGEDGAARPRLRRALWRPGGRDAPHRPAHPTPGQRAVLLRARRA